MRTIEGGGDLPGWIWDRAIASRSRLVMLDYDGTLAPFRIDREHAFPSRPLLALLGRLCETSGTRIAVVSGRPVAELARLLRPLSIPLAGEHGWETRSPDGQVIQHPLAPASSRALEYASMVVCRETWQDRIERKRTSLLLHTRGMSRGDAERIESRCARLWEPVIHEGGARLSHVSSGIELRATGRNKGTAVRELIADRPPETFAVYIGDDETDEDAFREVRETGAGILVADEKRVSYAVGRLASTGDVAEFLHRWYVVVESGEDGPQALATQPERE